MYKSISELEQEIDSFKEYMDEIEAEYSYDYIYEENEKNNAHYMYLIAKLDHRYRMLDVFSSLYTYTELQTFRRLRRLSNTLNTDVMNVISTFITGIN